MSRPARQARTGPQAAHEPSMASGTARADRTFVRLAARGLEMKQGRDTHFGAKC
jgi:hypothetical protein